MLAALALTALCTPAPQEPLSPDEPFLWTLDGTLDGVLGNDAEIFLPAGAGPDSNAPELRGARFSFRVETTGPHYLEMWSWYFDAYIVVIDEQGNLLAENDDGLIPPQARVLVPELSADRTYTALFCTVSGGVGPFGAMLRGGTPPADEQPLDRVQAEAWRILDAVDQLKELEDREPGALARLQARAGDRMRRLGYLNEARALCAEADAWFAAEFGPQDVETLRNRACLGQVLIGLGENEPAMQTFEQSLPIALELFDPTPGWMSDPLQAWGDQYLNADEVHEALVRYGLATNLRVEYSPYHPQTLGACESMADLLFTWDRDEEALPWARHAMELREALVPEDPVLLALLFNLANALLARDELEEARALFERGLALVGERFPEDRLQLASVNESLAWTVHRLGDAAAAQQLFDRAAELRAEALGEDHPRVQLGRVQQARFTDDRELLEASLARIGSADEESRRLRLQALLGAADLHCQEDEGQAAVELLTEGFELAAMLEEPDLRWQRSAHSLMGRCLRDQSRLEPARLQLDRAVELSLQLHGERHPASADALAARSRLARLDGRFRDAENDGVRAHAILLAIYGPESFPVAGARRDLARVLLDRGLYDDAHYLLLLALETYQSVPGEHREEVVSTNADIAMVHHLRGDVEAARAAYDRAKLDAEQVFGPLSMPLLNVLSNYSIFLYDQGLAEESVQHMRRAGEIADELFGPDSVQVGKHLHNIGTLLHTVGETEEGLAAMAQSREILERILSQDDPFRALMLRNSAAILWAEGDFERALEQLEEAHVIRLSTLGRGHPDTAEGLGHIGTVLLALGRLDEGLVRLDEAYGLMSAALGPEHPRTVLLLHKGAALQYLRGEYEDSWSLARRALADSRADLESSLLAWTEGEQFQHLEQQRTALDLFLTLAFSLELPGCEQAAFEAVLAWKGLGARFQRSHRELASTEQAELIAQLSETQARLSRLLYQREGADMESRSARLEELREERRVLELRVQEELGGVGPGSVPTLEELRIQLPPGSAAVELLLVSLLDEQTLARGRTLWSRPEAHERVMAWVLRPDREGVSRVDLGPSEELQQAVAPFLEELESSRGYGAVESSTNQRLVELLHAPLAEHLEGVELVLLSPDSFLGSLPFETLQLDDGSYLLERHAFVYLSDLASLPAILAADPPRGNSLFTVGGVDYGRRPREAEGELSPYRSAFPTWRPLAGTADETLAVQDLHSEAFGEQIERVSLTGAEASEERVKELLPGRAVLHLATHGFFRPKGLPSMTDRVALEGGGFEQRLRDEELEVIGYHPGLLSGLVLAGANAPAPGDRDEGLLTAEEVSWLDLSATDLVVLSACESGLGRPESGEGQIGLRRAFRLAGARTVLSSLFEVKDVETRDLVSAFYENLWLKHMGVLEALRAAQLEMLERNRYDYEDGRPSTWGAFVISGDWR